MTVLIADCETTGLLPSLSEPGARLWTIQLGDAETDEVKLYGEQPGMDGTFAEALDRLAAADRYVFHNGLGFDMEAINHFFPGAIEQHKLIDTLALARLAYPTEKQHTLKAWGLRLGQHKGDYKGDYQTWDAEFDLYSRQDIVVGRALWHKVKHVLEWGEAAQIEHDVTRAMILQERNGFRLDVAAAQRLDLVLRGEMDALDAELQAAFPPIQRTRYIVPKRDNRTRGYVAGVKTIAKQWMEPFDPGSRQQVAERLQLAGWKPRADAYGKDGVPSVDEKTLATVKIPEAALMIRYFTLSKKLGTLSDGKGGWLKLVGEDGIMHGRVNPNGAVTGRMSHFKPNVAQADKDSNMRSLWGPTRPGWLLVGCDAEGLEARLLAHFLYRWDNGALVRKVLEGNSDDRTDIHSSNLRGLIDAGLVPEAAWSDPRLFKIGRDCTKNDYYAHNYGARDPKLGDMAKLKLRELGFKAPATPSRELGARVRASLGRSMVGLAELTAACENRKKTRGYVIGLDGRRIDVTHATSPLNSLLQGGGGVVMKKALQLFMGVHGDHHGTEFALCGNIHDEVQMECRPDLAQAYGSSFAGCIREAGEHYKLRCPMAGKAAVGTNWSETH